MCSAKYVVLYRGMGAAVLRGELYLDLFSASRRGNMAVSVGPIGEFKVRVTSLFQRTRDPLALKMKRFHLPPQK